MMGRAKTVNRETKINWSGRDLRRSAAAAVRAQQLRRILRHTLWFNRRQRERK